jgi:hypothetical protein
MGPKKAIENGMRFLKESKNILPEKIRVPHNIK